LIHLRLLRGGLVAAILELGDKWVRGEAFIADLVATADAMKASMSVLKREVVKKDKILKEHIVELLPLDIEKELDKIIKK